MLVQPVSDASSASSSASELARTLEDETDSLFRFLGIVVRWCHSHSCPQRVWQALMPPSGDMVLVVLVVLHTQPQRDPIALLRTDEVFTPSEEAQLLQVRVSKRNFF